MKKAALIILALVFCSFIGSVWAEKTLGDFVSDGIIKLKLYRVDAENGSIRTEMKRVLWTPREAGERASQPYEWFRISEPRTSVGVNARLPWRTAVRQRDTTCHNNLHITYGNLKYIVEPTFEFMREDGTYEFTFVVKTVYGSQAPVKCYETPEGQTIVSKPPSSSGNWPLVGFFVEVYDKANADPTGEMFSNCGFRFKYYNAGSVGMAGIFGTDYIDITEIDFYKEEIRLKWLPEFISSSDGSDFEKTLAQQLIGAGGGVNQNDVDDDGDGYTENQNDCDDTNPSIHPNANECNADGSGDQIDNDCDQQIDEGCSGPSPLPTQFDDDRDGYSEIQGDCDDTDPNIHPGADECLFDGSPNGIDDDCDGVVDNGCTGTGPDPNAVDNDRDGYTENQNDCDDSNPNINPGADECLFDGTGNGVDDDCDGVVDNGCTGTSPDPNTVDNDNDGFTKNQGDCDDSNPNAYPGAVELCGPDRTGNGIDEDCDGTADNGCGGQPVELITSYFYWDEVPGQGEERSDYDNTRDRIAGTWSDFSGLDAEAIKKAVYVDLLDTYFEMREFVSADQPVAGTKLACTSTRDYKGVVLSRADGLTTTVDYVIRCLNTKTNTDYVWVLKYKSGGIAVRDVVKLHVGANGVFTYVTEPLQRGEPI